MLVMLIISLAVGVIEWEGWQPAWLIFFRWGQNLNTGRRIKLSNPLINSWYLTSVHLSSETQHYQQSTLAQRDVFFCSIKDLNLIFCSELLSNECKVLDLEAGRLANGFVSLLSSMPHSLLLSMLWLTWFAGQIHRREDDVLTYINARMPVI